MKIAFLVFVTVALSACVHTTDLGVAKAGCDRDGGQWMVEYNEYGDETRWACVYKR
jgi:hypothetical protein